MSVGPARLNLHIPRPEGTNHNYNDPEVDYDCVLQVTWWNAMSRHYEGPVPVGENAQTVIERDRWPRNNPSLSQWLLDRILPRGPEEPEYVMTVTSADQQFGFNFQVVQLPLAVPDWDPNRAIDPNHHPPEIVAASDHDSPTEEENAEAEPEAEPESDPGSAVATPMPLPPGSQFQEIQVLPTLEEFVRTACLFFFLYLAQQKLAL
ncbi:MAG: hypothetical protein M1837_004134 [Sclerophora amabilis]|nr:MAG: hypothetical protein M1837_004134 [Sclerophora amabilis]